MMTPETVPVLNRDETLKALAAFNAYFVSCNGVPPNARIPVPTVEWRTLYAGLQALLQDQVQKPTRKPFPFDAWASAASEGVKQEMATAAAQKRPLHIPFEVTAMLNFLWQPHRYNHPTDAPQAGLLPFPREAVDKVISGQMDVCAGNGANSISMPEHLVALAHLISFGEDYDMPAEVVHVLPDNFKTMWQMAYASFQGAFCGHEASMMRKDGYSNLARSQLASINECVTGAAFKPQLSLGREAEDYAEVNAVHLARLLPKAEPMEPTRDAIGEWTHPAYANVLAAGDPVKLTWLSLNGLSIYKTLFLEDVSDERVDEWSQNGGSFADWNPTPPQHPDAFILTIYDEEDGPVCEWGLPRQNLF